MAEIKDSYICKSGAVFRWQRTENTTGGVLSGWFDTPATDADIKEAQQYLHTLLPPNSTPAFSRVLRGGETTVRQQATALTDQLLGRQSRN